MELIEQIGQLRAQGLIGDELVPTERYWHWPVLKPESLPDWAFVQYRMFGEIRWFGDESDKRDHYLRSGAWMGKW